MSAVVTKIKKTGSNYWYTLPTPFAITGGSEVLDSAESGRDNNTGVMYRDIVREDVMNFTVELPWGIDNIEMVKIIDILSSESFDMYLPDTTYGGFSGEKGYVFKNNYNNDVEEVTVPIRHFYAPNFKPVIHRINDASPNTPSWEYESCTFNAIEL